MMKVIFEFKDNSGVLDKANTTVKELSNDEILIILKSNEITYGVNTGFLFTSKLCVIENTVYDMFAETCLKITLKEKKTG
jgi:hypothetical protein